jgi:hypothetical protein
MLKIFSALLIVLLSFDLYAGEESEDVHKTRVFLEKTLVDKGYHGALILGFDKGKRMALTTLYFSENDPEYIRTAEISEEADGASVYFRTYKKCHITDKVLDKIITVDEQRIPAFFKLVVTIDRFKRPVFLPF